MNSKELAELIVSVLDEKNGGEIQTIEMAEKSSIADYFVIATGKNLTHVRALAENLEEKLEAQEIFASRKEGIREGRWAVIDYDDVIVHIFNAETREFYCLERLWSQRQ